MAIIKSTAQRLLEAQRENAELRTKLEKEHEKMQFLGLLAADVDLDELTEEEAQDDGE